MGTVTIRAGPAGVVGTPRYMPPEAHQGVLTSKYDVYSYGLTMLHLGTGSTPWAHLTASNVWALIIMITTDPMVHPIPEFLPATLRKLIRDCIQVDPQDRTEFEQLATHEFFADDEGCK